MRLRAQHSMVKHAAMGPGQEPSEAGPGIRIEPRWSSRDGSCMQAAPALWASVATRRQTLARLAPSRRRSRPGRAVPAATASPDGAPPLAPASDPPTAKRCHPLRTTSRGLTPTYVTPLP